MSDLSNLAALISADVASRDAGRPDPGDVLNVPVMNRASVDGETDRVWAVVRVDLGGGHLAELDLKKYLPATIDVEARYAQRDNGVHRLCLVDADGVLHGVTITAPRPRDDEDETATVAEAEDWDES